MVDGFRLDVRSAPARASQLVSGFGRLRLTVRCDSHLLPVSPPPSFTLPPSASIILPAPTATDPNAKVKRTATWRWLDDDWSTIRAGQGQSSTSTTGAISPSPIADGDYQTGHIPRSSSMSFGMSPPPPDDAAATGSRAPSMAEQAFAKGLERLKARTTTPQGKSTSPRSSVELARPRTGSGASEDHEPLQPMLPATNPMPTETIREKDDVSVLTSSRIPILHPHSPSL